MLKYITKDEYVDLLDAESIPNNLENLIIEASNFIDYHTRKRIDKNNPSEQIKYVTCLLVNLIDEEKAKINEIGNLQAENVEGWSKTYTTPEEVKEDYKSRKIDILKKYLTYEIGIDGLPLLYIGGVS